MGYVDADWATDQETRRSVSGFVVGYLHDDGTLSPITWRAKSQSVVAKSSFEAEYVACAEICKEIYYIREFLCEMGWRDDRPVPVFCDNRAAVLVGNDDVKRLKQARYVSIRFHYARDCKRQGVVTYCKIGTKDNVADAFTKSLTVDRHTLLTSRIVKNIRDERE